MGSNSLRSTPQVSTEQQAPKIRVVWAMDLRGRQPVRDWLDSLDELQRRHVANLVDLLGMSGGAVMGDRLCALPRGIGIPAKVTEGLFILRADRTVRIIGGFRPGGVFVAALGTIKRQDRFNIPDILTAKRILREHDIVSNASGPFIAKHTPTPNPTFRPTIVAPPRPAAITETSDTAPPVALFKAKPSEYEWTLAKTDDLLPPHAPLAQSLCRLPRIHHVIFGDEVEAFVREKLAAMDTYTKMALGLLDGDATHVRLGAAWGVELLMARELAREPEPTPEPSTPEVPPPTPEAEAPVPVPPPRLEAPRPPRLYWLRAGTRTAKRFLIEVVGDGHARTSHRTGVKVPKVLACTYVARAGRWTRPRLKPAAWFTDANAASTGDPFVREAMMRRRR